MQSLSLLHEILSTIPSRLEKLPDHDRRPAPEKWSSKEELGHLIDSAANNHQRIVRAQLANGLAMPGYEQEKWVSVHAYQHRDWRDLIGLWTALNRQLLAAAESVPASAWAHKCTVAGSEPLTLQFVFEDYLQHMLHHLAHIGIEIDDLQAVPK